VKDLWKRLTGERMARLDRADLARGDPWVRLPLAPPFGAYGPGAQDEFPTYLEGPSRVSAPSPAAVASWLLSCRYAADEHLLDAHDHWLHPSTFELVRAGDCEDFALWGWRKLVEASIDATFVVGMSAAANGTPVRHAWVTFRDGSDEFVLDGVQRSLELIVRPRAILGEAYVPQVGADREGRRVAFAGLFRSEWGRRVPLQPHPSR
jgi:hypothetical protein